MKDKYKNEFNSREHRLSVKFINSTFKLGQIIGLSKKNLDSDKILEKAKRKTGLDDFSNKKYLETMERLVNNINKLKMRPLAKFFLKFVILKTAINRLYIEDFIKKHPEIKDIPIKSPMFIIGFPRTGTTLLQNVLSSGPGYRGLYLWEIVTPYPLHENKEKDKKKRMRKIDLPLRLLKLGVSEFNSIHDARADTKEECWVLLGNSLCITNTDTVTGLNEWNDWLMSSDRRWAYEEYKRLLQIQAYVTPTERFVLKCPTHIWNLKPLLEVFPDARIVWIHRSPIKSIASTSSLSTFARVFFFGYGNQKELGEMVEEKFHLIVVDAMKFRKQIKKNQIFDLNYEDLIKDIPGAVKEIRSYFGFTHNTEHNNAVQEFLAKPRKDKPGKHKYSHEQFGLDPKEITNRFSDYIKRFDIKV